MATKIQLAAALDVNVKTIRNHEKEGYAFVYNESGSIDIEKSVHAYVNYLSETVRQLKANNGRKTGGTSRNSKQPKTLEDWKKEKEKQAAIKLQLQNEKDKGELIPAEAMFELYNAPLSTVKSKLLDLSNQIQKRVSLKPEEVKQVDEVVRAALDKLNGKSLDELYPIIEEILERYSRFYRSASEDADSTMGSE
jgi:phage terminase Nu1 subunit (DNA packaging protein)